MSKYYIYPTLMDSYEWMQAADDEVAYIQRRDELLAKINRVKIAPTYAASRGTALNEIIDTHLSGSMCDMVHDGRDYYLHNGFVFDVQFVDGLTERVRGMIQQPLLRATIQTDHGEVKLYGYADYVDCDSVVDLKTTDNYTAGKYRNNWQHRVYPYCLVRGGLMEQVNDFTYLIAELHEKENYVIDGGMVFTESYHTPIVECEYEIRQSLDNGLLAFIEDHREEITNTRIFGK